MLTKTSNATDKTPLGDDLARPFGAVSTESLLAIAALQPRGEDDKTPVVFQAISMSPPMASEPEQLAALLSPKGDFATLGAPPSKTQVARVGKKARRGWHLVVGAAGVGVAQVKKGFVMLRGEISLYPPLAAQGSEPAVMSRGARRGLQRPNNARKRGWR